MSIPTFIDISEVEQCEELREYLLSLGAEMSESKCDSFISDLKQIISFCDIVLNESIKESDIESVLNSIVSLLILSVPQSSQEANQLIDDFCQQLLKAKTTKTALIALRVLKNLLGGLNDIIDIRFKVYFTLIRLSSNFNLNLQNNQIFSDLNQLKQWFPLSSIGIERTQQLLRLLYEVLLHQKQYELSSRVMIELLSTYTEENASQARDDAHKCIVSLLMDQNTFLMDHLLTLKPVKFLEGEPIHDLLTIFVSEKLSSYIKFYNAHKELVESLGLSHEQNLQKMRLLTFMQMAENKKEISFDLIQSDLQLNADQVESFVIDVLRTKLVKAKVDQLQKRVMVSSTMHRTFGRQQWLQLRDTLSKWSINLGQVQHSIQQAIHSYETIQA